MKKMQRILRLLLIPVLLIPVLLLPVPAGAEQDMGFGLTMTASQPSVLVGETVMLTVQADRDVLSRGAGITVYYDDSALELDPEGSSAAAPFAIHGPLKVNGKSAFRISFLPGTEPVAISAAEPLAVVCFKALAVAARTDITMGGVYVYDGQLAELPAVLPEAVSLTLEPSVEWIPVTGITLDQTAVTVEEGELTALKAKITPIGASDPTVLWTSSDEAVAAVSGGVVKGIRSGEAVITAATNDGGFTASCSVTVVPPNAGYIVEMPDDTVSSPGKTIQIPVTIRNEDPDIGYNAFDIDFTYDPAVLELVSTSIPDMILRAEPGRVNVLSYGEVRESGTIPFLLEFKVLAAQTTQIRITEARVDNSGNAVVKNTSLAVLGNDRTQITVSGYPAILPDSFTGMQNAVPGEAYTFAVPKDCFDYTVTVTVGGVKVIPVDNGDGTYTVPAELVTGDIVVTAERTGKHYSVTLGTDMSGDEKAQHGVDYTAALDQKSGYRYTVTVTVGGARYTGYTASGKNYTIPGEDITGEIVFKVTKTKTSTGTGTGTSQTVTQTKPAVNHEVIFSGSGAGAAEGNAATVANGKKYTLTLQKEQGYVYRVYYIMGGKSKVEVQSNADGNYIIKNVTGALEIIIEKELNNLVSVHEFVTMDKLSAFLILAKAELKEGSIYTYRDEPMHYSQVYGGWVHLVISPEELTTEAVQPLIKIVSQPKLVLTPAGADADQNGVVDIQDVKLVRDLYNAAYSTFDEVSMTMFLNADINGDKKLDVLDAAAVVRTILEQ